MRSDGHPGDPVTEPEIAPLPSVYLTLAVSPEIDVRFRASVDGDRLRQAVDKALAESD
jgi:hypothetical protein